MSEIPQRDVGSPQNPESDKQKLPPQQEKQVQPQSGYQVPTEVVDLPSKGLLYPKDHPQSSGQVEMKFMTAKEEDILTNQSYIRRQIVIDKLLQSLIVSEVDYDSLLSVDIEALMIAARIMGYGPEYSFEVTTPSGNKQVETVDLTQFEDKEFDQSMITKGVNLFEYLLPTSGWLVKFKLMTKADEDKISRIEQSYKKVGKSAGSVTILLKTLIQEIDGISDKGEIAKRIDMMRASDARALRKHIANIQPGLDLSMQVVDNQTGDPFRTDLSIEPQFFWPDYE